MLNGLRFFAWKMRSRLWNLLGGTRYRTQVFEQIYNQNLWSDAESRSGSGSSLSATEALRPKLLALFNAYGIKTILDAPCGDFVWMKYVANHLEQYTGVDIVPEIIALNKKNYETENIKFVCADISTTLLECADAIVCRDCFIHLPTAMITQTLQKFKASGSTYLLLTQDSDIQNYHDIPLGSFRSINFRNAPFNFPEPLEAISEGDVAHGRVLAMWKLESLPEI